MTPLSDLGYLGHGLMQLRSAIAERTAEDVPGEALAVDAHQDWFVLHSNVAVLFAADTAQAQGEVRLRIDKRGVGDQIKIAELIRQFN